MAPSKLLPFVASPLLSIGGRLRVALEPLVPRRRGGGDESLASFVRRRLGSQVLERIAQPMVGGIYTADPERLSLEATLPRFLEMERTHGSIVRALARARRRAESGVAGASGPRYDLFVSLRDGMEQLPRALAAKLPPGTIRTDCRVARVWQDAGIWRAATAHGEVSADVLCLATPAYDTSRLLEDVEPVLARGLRQIDYASTATVTYAYARSDVAHALDGFGFLVPAIERRSLLGCTFANVKFPNRAPPHVALLRAFVGGALFPEILEKSDEEIVDAVRYDLEQLLGVHGRPMWTVVTRHNRSMPQYDVDHLARVEKIEAAVADLSGLVIAGNAYRGAGIPDTVRSGEEAAETAIDLLLRTRGR